MRRYLKSELKRRFNIAWKMIPDPIQESLKEYVHRIKEVASLEEAEIMLSDGSKHTPNSDEGGYFFNDDTRYPSRGFILLNSKLAEAPEYETIATILHELAHAIEAYEDDWRTKMIADNRSEGYAWLQAAAWAARDKSSYKGAINVIFFSLVNGQYRLGFESPGMSPTDIVLKAKFDELIDSFLRPLPDTDRQSEVSE